MKRLVVIVALLAGCGQSHNRDAGADSGADAPTDATTDVSIDSGVRDAVVRLDSAPDAQDAATDVAPDVCVPSCGERSCGPDFCGGLCDDRVCNPGVESFEEFVASGDFSAALDTPALLASGLSITQPFPNPSGTANARVLDCAFLGGYFRFLCEEDADSIPDGTAFLGYAWWMEPLELELPASVQTVRFHVATTELWEPWQLHVSARDEAGLMVTEITTTVGQLGTWATPIVIESSRWEIKTIHMTRAPEVLGTLLLDHVSWE